MATLESDVVTTSETDVGTTHFRPCHNVVTTSTTTLWQRCHNVAVPAGLLVCSKNDNVFAIRVKFSYGFLAIHQFLAYKIFCFIWAIVGTDMVSSLSANKISSNPRVQELLSISQNIKSFFREGFLIFQARKFTSWNVRSFLGFPFPEVNKSFLDGFFLFFKLGLKSAGFHSRKYKKIWKNTGIFFNIRAIIYY